MQKRLLVIAAGLLQIPVIIKARDMGYYVIAVDGDTNAPGLAKADKGVVLNILDKEAMLQLARRENVDGTIHPCSEVAMDVMGYINDQMGLPGISEAISIRATNKHEMRLAFEKGGAPSPLSIYTTSADDAWDCFEKKFPTNAIIKPSRNSGSRGIAKVVKGVSKEEFSQLYDRALKESRDHSVLIEQFVDGPEFSVEVVVYNGVPHVLQVTDKKTTESPYFVELGHSQPSLFSQDIVERLKKGAILGIKALELNNCAAHAELKVMEGQPYLMEIGARMGGDFISTELTHISTGIDMVAAAIDVALGKNPRLEVKKEPRGVCIRYFCPKPGKLVTVCNLESLDDPRVFKKEIYVQAGEVIPEVTSSLSRSGHVIVIEDTAQKAIEFAERLIDDVIFITQ